MRTPDEERLEVPDPGAADGADTQADDLVVVRFVGNRRDFFHDRDGTGVRPGQHCLVEADRGRDLGLVCYRGPGPRRWWERAEGQGVVAVATAEALARLPELRREERDARDVFLRRVAEHGLPMELAGSERRWDRGKLTFYFLAEGRVDFRALVRDLAGTFRTRIELRQIGVRDEARLRGGLGICGREFCCATFLEGFASVALRMAKDQQLPLNPAKLSGPCGRLRCCLAYEHDQYRDALHELPRLNSDVVWQGRPGRARKLDPLRRLVGVELRDDGHEVVEVAAADLDFNRHAADAGSEASDASGPTTGDGSRRRRPRRRGGRRHGGGRKDSDP